jgi:hypothetical protein
VEACGSLTRGGHGYRGSGTNRTLRWYTERVFTRQCPAPSGPQQRRWWVVDLLEDPTPGGCLVEAPDGPTAVASFRAGLDPHFTGTAAVTAGPLTASEAFTHDLGWTWAWEMGEPRYAGSARTVPPARPATRDEAAAVLGENLAADIERHLAAAYT